MTILNYTDASEQGGIFSLQNRVTAAIERHRKLLFILVALLYIGSFNGKWRLGLDTAIYRGLALNIASGKGYTFGDWAPKQVYPGLPYSLAAIEYVLGPKDRTPSLAEQNRLIGPSLATTGSVFFILAIASLTLIVVYKLIHLHYPKWVAVTITCGVATNQIFLTHSHELLTDVPFLFGVVTSLYGWDLLKRAQNSKSRINAIAVVIPGLIFAATMRPTFWILAGCWIAVCLWGLIVGPRKFYAICLGVLLGIWAILIAIDPRYKGFHPLSGGYESEALYLLPQAPAHFYQQLHHILYDQFPAAMFGQQMSPFSTLSSLIVIGSTLLLFRRHALWVLMVFGTLAATLIVSAEPRYYMMVLPVLLLGWLTMFCMLARKASKVWGEMILVLGLAILTLNNLSATVGFFIEQHHSNFISHYKKGAYVPALEMCEALRQRLSPDQKVLGPSGAIMSVFSGIHVYTQREMLPRGENMHSAEAVAATHLDYAITPGILYRDKEPAIARMFRKRIILPTKVIATTSAGWHLTTILVTVPPTDWRKLPSDWRPSTTKPVKKHSTTRPRRKKRRPATTQTTQPATQPLRAMTTMLSPVLFGASGPELSAVLVNGGSDWIFDTAAARCGSGGSFDVVNFFIMKYAAAAGRINPCLFNFPAS
jgi:hypothetical protein